MRFQSHFFALAVSLAFFLINATAQQQIAVNTSAAPDGYGIEVEVVNDNIGPVAGAAGLADLTGFSTYRIYVVTNNANDFVSSISGDATNPTYVESTTSFWHDLGTGANTGGGIQSFLLGLFPALNYDSWVTIGLESTPIAALGEAAVSTVQSDSNPWLTNFDPVGGNIAIDDGIGGAWYALNGDSNGIAGDDLKVLVGQFTTDGEFSGQLYAQVFIEGDGSNEFRDTFYFGAGVPGCMDATACNYSADATSDDGSCTYPSSTNVDCDGNCLNDADTDGICDEDEIPGCTDGTACNYNSSATDDDDSCAYADAGYDCDGNCLSDDDGDGVCNEFEVSGCDDATACNYDAAATENDGSCTYPAAGLDCDGNCLADADSDGVCDGDEVAGCDDNAACNFDAAATDNDGSCVFPDQYYDCDGNCNNDADGDGICDELETVGCTDADACNYSPVATEDDGSCTYPAADNLNCDGSCINDADGDGTCDEDEVGGCTDSEACNYDSAATEEDGSCTYPPADNRDCAGNCLNDADGDNVCDEDEIPGCQDAEACNYNATATDSDGSCTYAAEYYDCDGNCLNDSDDDGVCDELEIDGCTENGACNYDATATDNDGSCEYLSCAGCMGSEACNYDNEATIDDGSCLYADDPCETCNTDGTVNPNDDDMDGVCNADEIVGCQEQAACNYDPAATDAGNCDYPIDLYGVDNVDCDGECLNDTDGDLVCDEDEIVGCQESAACNYDATATDPGACEYPIDLYGKDYVDCDGNCLNDADGDLVCDEDEIQGCQDAEACNYNVDATDEDGSCTYPAEFYLDCDGACINDEDGDGLCDEVEALIPPVYNPDWNGDYCYTVADLTHLLCLFGVCGPDTTGAEGYNPFFQEDSCFSAFDITAFLTLYQTCLEVTEEQPANGSGSGAEDDGMNDDATNEDDE